ncbi:MAG: DUF4387 domain-containing protein [Bacillota bacterium]
MGGKVKLKEIASVIRSKNAGPYELTFDIIFRDGETYQQVKRLGIINRRLMEDLYGIPAEDVLSLVEFDPANAIKITVKRPRAAGDVGETDVYGAQQHAPLLDVEIPL